MVYETNLIIIQAHTHTQIFRHHLTQISGLAYFVATCNPHFLCMAFSFHSCLTISFSLFSAISILAASSQLYLVPSHSFTINTMNELSNCINFTEKHFQLHHSICTTTLILILILYLDAHLFCILNKSNLLSPSF